MTFAIDAGGRTRTVDVAGRGPRVLLDGKPYDADIARVGPRWSLIVAGRSYEAAIDETAGGLIVHVNGRPVVVTVSASGPRGARRPQVLIAEHKGGSRRVVAPMPGRVVKVLVKVGDTVAARQGLVVVEAMKLENELRSPSAGVVTEIRAAEGALVDANALLVVIE